MKTFRNIFLWFGVFIMLGHSIAPHCHNGHDEDHAICQVESLESVSFLHFLGSFFHADPGDNHLEEFQLPGFDYFIESKSVGLSAACSPITAFILHADVLPYGKCLAPPHLRGPPVVM